MTTRVLKSRLARCEKFVALWRKRLGVDPKWNVEVQYSASQPPNGPEDVGALDIDKAEYWTVVLVLYPYLFTDENWTDTMERTVVHELLHLVLWQYSSFAQNMCGNKCRKELDKLEDQIVQQLEDILMDVKWGRK